MNGKTAPIFRPGRRVIWKAPTAALIRVQTKRDTFYEVAMTTQGVNLFTHSRSDALGLFKAITACCEPPVAVLRKWKPM